MVSSEAFDGVVTVDPGAHPLEFMTGAHAAVIQVGQGLASTHVTALYVSITDGAFEYSFTVRTRRVSVLSVPTLRGHATAPTGERVSIGARARDEHERSFDLLVGTGRDETVVGSVRLGQRVLMDGIRAEKRELWPFAVPQVAA